MTFPPVVLIVFEFAHIVSAMGWLGGGLLTGFVLGPNLRKLPAPAALEFNSKIIPKILTFIQMTAASTLLFGILLLYVYLGGDMSSLTSTTEGVELSAAISLALATGVLAYGVTIPSFKRVSEIATQLLAGGQQPPPPEMMKYGKRARMASMAGVFLLLVVVALMVSAAY